MGCFIRWVIAHGIALAIGFGLGVYFLPILTAPPAPDAAKLEQMASQAQFSAEFTCDLRGSDLAYWGEHKSVLSFFDGVCFARGKCADARGWSVQSCVRPLIAASVFAAGLDGVRKTVPNRRRDPLSSGQSTGFQIFG